MPTAVTTAAGGRPDTATIDHRRHVLARDFGASTGFAAPRRLPRATRDYAARTLAGEFGAAIEPAAFAVDAPADASPHRRYALTVHAIAEHAPLGIVEGERVHGAATLLEATQHRTPLGEFPSTSHTTLDFERALGEGPAGLRRRLAERLTRPATAAQRDVLEAMQLCLEAQVAWQRRYLEATGSPVVAAVLDAPPKTFAQAVQALAFWWGFQRLCGNWSGVGRLDKMLGSYLAEDLARGRLDLDDARDLLAHFWIKGCNWIGAGPKFGGDAQFYQNIVLGGTADDGSDLVNDVTYLVLDVVEELHVSDFPVAVRVSTRTPEELWRRIAMVQRRGGGIVSIYNEDLVLEALTRFGYTIEEARTFANDGCWEVILPGRTAFGYRPFDSLQVLQRAAGVVGAAPPPEFADFEDLYAAWRRELAAAVAGVQDEGDASFRDGFPSPLLSLLVDDCIERGRGYHDRGARYAVRAPHAGGLPDAANSLLAFKKLVWEEQRLGFAEFVRLLRADWEGRDDLRREIAARFAWYGNDDPEADAMLVRCYDDFIAECAKVPEREGVRRPPGISTFGRELQWAPEREATAFGRRRHSVLAPNLAPTPGTDLAGPTAVIRSHCRCDFRKLPNGVPLDLKILPDSVRGETGLAALVALLKTFVALGGFYLQVDCVSADILRAAQERPEDFPNLSVRISGWSARFATLARDWQDMIIARTEQRLG